MRNLFRMALRVTLAAVFTAACSRETPVAKTETGKAAPPPAAAATNTPAAPAPPATGSTEVGALMPAYQAQWLDGRPMDLAAERGRVVFLNLWATWCGPCRYEIPRLQQLHDQYAAQGFEVIGVTLDETSPAPVREFAQKQGMKYPIALDPEGRLANLLQSQMIPVSVLIDRNGRIVWKSAGALLGEDKELNSALASALGQPARPGA